MLTTVLSELYEHVSVCYWHAQHPITKSKQKTYLNMNGAFHTSALLCVRLSVATGPNPEHIHRAIQTRSSLVRQQKTYAWNVKRS